MRTTRLFSSTLCAAFLAAAGLHAASPVEPRFQQTKDLMVLVAGATELVGEQGVEAACEEFKAEDSSWLHGDSYVFVLDMEGNAICHPARPTLEGRNVMEMRDPAGRPIMQNMLRELESGDDGWIHYQWPRPGGSVFYWKTSHVRRARDEQGEYVVGSGAYQMPMERLFVVEQVEDAMALIREEGAGAWEVLRDDSRGYIFYTAYVFVIDSAGKMIVNKAFPANEGSSVLDLEDIDGRRFVREMMAVAKDGSAWIDYKWPKPGDTRPSLKSSYVRRLEVDGELLVVGAGVYFDPEPEVRDLGPAPDVQ